MTIYKSKILENSVGVRKLDIAININEFLHIRSAVLIITGSSSTVTTWRGDVPKAFSVTRIYPYETQN